MFENAPDYKKNTLQLATIKENMARGGKEKFYCLQYSLMRYLDETYTIYDHNGEITPSFWRLVKRVKAIVGEGDSVIKATESWHQKHKEFKKGGLARFEIILNEPESDEE